MKKSKKQAVKVVRADDFFSPLENTKPYFKAAFEGFAGSGKTYSAAQVAVGLHEMIGSKKPVVIFDTEKASKFLKPLFANHKIEVLVRESRSMADLSETMRRLREGLSDIRRLFIKHTGRNQEFVRKWWEMCSLSEDKIGS